MTPQEAFNVLSGSGLPLCPLPNGRLRVEPLSLITSDARELIVTHREALLRLSSANSVAADWRRLLQAMKHPGEGELAHLRAALIEAAGVPWLPDAYGKGWDAVSLFGVHSVAPTVRTEAWGLCVRLALSPFNRRDHNDQWHRTRLIEITAYTARIETPAGARFGTDRHDPNRAYAVPVWDLPAFAPAVPFSDNYAQTSARQSAGGARS